MRRDLPSYVVLPNWLGGLQEKGQYRRPGEYAGWLGPEKRVISIARLSCFPSPIFAPVSLYASTAKTALRSSDSIAFAFTVTFMPMGVGAECLISTL